MKIEIRMPNDSTIGINSDDIKILRTDYENTEDKFGNKIYIYCHYIIVSKEVSEYFYNPSLIPLTKEGDNYEIRVGGHEYYRIVNIMNEIVHGETVMADKKINETKEIIDNPFYGMEI